MLASEIIRRVREIQVRTGRQVADVLAGEYVSVFKGGGVEFDFPILLIGQAERSRVKGDVNGGGELVRIRTSGGPIRIQER